jgi:RNA polymerase subunit RPABC4/transcription elongation factor Spt4
MNLNPTTLSSLVYILSGFGIAFIVALWLGLVIWTYRDIRSRARDRLARILAVLIVALLFLPGLIIYFILRPSKTIEEEYQHTLEEEALLQSIEDNPVCPGCGRKTQSDWIVCPNCHTRLKKPCHHCQRLLELSWNLCPYCATPAPGMRKENISMDEALQELTTPEVKEEIVPEEKTVKDFALNNEPEETPKSDKDIEGNGS